MMAFDEGNDDCMGGDWFLFSDGDKEDVVLQVGWERSVEGRAPLNMLEIRRVKVTVSHDDETKWLSIRRTFYSGGARR